MRIVLAQLNPVVGDLDHNCQKILHFCQRAQELDAELVVFPELSITGYPPKDLLLRKDFLRGQLTFLDRIAKETEVMALVGAALLDGGSDRPYNCLVSCFKGHSDIVAKKRLLPNYGVFDEKRYFLTPGDEACDVIQVGEHKILLSICEDAWNSLPSYRDHHYPFDPVLSAMAEHEVDLILNVSASPFSRSKPKIREEIFTHIAKTHKKKVLVCGQVGANDQLLFDGHSMVIDETGQIIQHAAACREDMLVYDSGRSLARGPVVTRLLSDDELVMEAIIMGIHDYVTKCHQPGVILGVSGGIDSAVCAALAVKALGANRVRAIFLPSRFSSGESLADAQALANNLKLKLEIYAIEDCVQELRKQLMDVISSCPEKNADILDQNLQSRMRGLMIMALSNASDHLMMATSNKSELAVGYSTIYGDMCGAFSAIGDLYKTQVKILAHTLNQDRQVIPRSIIEKAPTAELKPEQLDTDTLPPYEDLDKILFNFIELEMNAGEIARLCDKPLSLVEQVIDMVAYSEYKRRQGPFPLMVSDKVFGDARRLPIAKRVPRLR